MLPTLANLSSSSPLLWDGQTLSILPRSSAASCPDPLAESFAPASTGLLQSLVYYCYPTSTSVAPASLPVPDSLQSVVPYICASTNTTTSSQSRPLPALPFHLSPFGAAMLRTVGIARLPALNVPASPAPTGFLCLSSSATRKRNFTDVCGSGQGSNSVMAYNVVYAAAAYNGGNSAKRMRLSEDQPKPSRVLHLRGLPPDTTEAEIFQLTQMFGSVTNIILTRSKNQALVEMSDVNTAQLMVDYYCNVPARIRNQMVHVQYSVHDVLKVDQSSQSCEPALEGDGQHAILRVIVDNMLYPVTLDTLHALFSKYGQVLRIITFSKNNSFQALVEFSDGQSAQTAKMSLNGQNVYNGCCSLHIDFSKLKRLSVRYNNDKSRDYTNNQLSSDEPGMQPPGSGSHHQQQHGPPAIMHYDGSAEGPGGSGDGPIPAGPAGPGVWGAYPNNQGAFGVHMGGSHMGGMEAAGNSIFGCYPGPMTYGFTAGMPGGTFGTMQMPQFFNPAMNSAMQGPGGHYQRQHQQRRQAPVPAGTGAVLLVSNLETEKVTPDALFTLFGVYGDVLRVKILFNKKDTAMIQFIDASQAQRALSNLDYVRLFGKQMKVSASKHAVVQMPKEGTPDAHLTQDYSTSPLHRFHNPNSKNHLHIAPPSDTLHLSNLPPQATEEFLRSMFSQFGTVAGFKFFEKDAKMALIQMSTTDEAVDALTLLHNADLGSNARLRVTFTKSTIEGAGTKH